MYRGVLLVCVIQRCRLPIKACNSICQSETSHMSKHFLVYMLSTLVHKHTSKKENWKQTIFHRFEIEMKGSRSSSASQFTPKFWASHLGREAHWSDGQCMMYKAVPCDQRFDGWCSMMDVSLPRPCRRCWMGSCFYQDNDKNCSVWSLFIICCDRMSLSFSFSNNAKCYWTWPQPWQTDTRVNYSTFKCLSEKPAINEGVFHTAVL